MEQRYHARFEGNDAASKALQKWFDHIQNTEGDSKGGRAERAELRRAQTPDDIIFLTAFHRFLKWPALPGYLREEKYWTAMAMVAGALSHCRQHTNSDDSFATQLGKPQEKGGKAPLSELRFSQLQKSRDPEEFYRRLLRAISLIGGNVNIISLADSVLHWYAEYLGYVNRQPVKRLAVEWARDYFAAAPADNA